MRLRSDQSGSSSRAELPPAYNSFSPAAPHHESDDHIYIASIHANLYADDDVDADDDLAAPEDMLIDLQSLLASPSPPPLYASFDMSCSHPHPRAGNTRSRTTSANSASTTIATTPSTTTTSSSSFAQDMDWDEIQLLLLPEGDRDAGCSGATILTTTSPAANQHHKRREMAAAMINCDVLGGHTILPPTLPRFSKAAGSATAAGGFGRHLVDEDLLPTEVYAPAVACNFNTSSAMDPWFGAQKAASTETASPINPTTHPLLQQHYSPKETNYYSKQRTSPVPDATGVGSPAVERRRRSWLQPESAAASHLPSGRRSWLGAYSTSTSNYSSNLGRTPMQQPSAVGMGVYELPLSRCNYYGSSADLDPTPRLQYGVVVKAATPALLRRRCQSQGAVVSSEEQRPASTTTSSSSINSACKPLNSLQQSKEAAEKMQRNSQPHGRSDGEAILVLRECTCCSSSRKEDEEVAQPVRSSGGGEKTPLVCGDGGGGREEDAKAAREAAWVAAALEPVDWEGVVEETARSRPRRRNVRISKDPQSVSARRRRERISDRIRVLQRLIPNAAKMDTASMLDEALHYLQFLQSHVAKATAGPTPTPPPAPRHLHAIKQN